MSNLIIQPTTTDGPLAWPLEDHDPFLEALAVWLEGKGKNTRKSYATAVRDFFQFAGKRPDQIKPVDVARWKEYLKDLGRADSTVAQRLSAISSLFSYLQRPQADGRPLLEFNPVDGVERGDLEVSPYDSARKLTASQFKNILAQIDDDDVAGALHKAALVFYVLCARRREEVADLRGGHLRWDGDRMTYRVRLKGGKVKWKELPPPVWKAIRRYLELAGRQLDDESPVFVATVDNGRYLQAHYGAKAPEGEQPITGEALAQALKRYAERAGLDPDQVSLHSLRHLGAALFHQASGGDVRQTQMFLDHAHLNTTQVYLDQLTGEAHRHWQEMANALGV